MLVICALTCVMTLLTLFVPIEIMICFLDGPLVIILTLNLLFWFVLFIMLCISMILSDEISGKVFLILIISLILSLKTCVYNYLLVLEAEFDDWFFLKNLDLAKILLLSLRGIDRGICKILACFPFTSLLMVVFLIGIFLNYKDMYCLKYIFFLLAVSLFYSDLYIADKNLQVANPNSTIYIMFLTILFSNKYYLINAANLRREHLLSTHLL